MSLAQAPSSEYSEALQVTAAPHSQSDRLERVGSASWNPV